MAWQLQYNAYGARAPVWNGPRVTGPMVDLNGTGHKPPRRRARGGWRRRRKNKSPTPGPYAIILVPGAPPCNTYQNARTGSLRGAPPPPAYPPPAEGSPEAAAALAYFYNGHAPPDSYHTQYVTWSDGTAFTFKHRQGQGYARHVQWRFVVQSAARRLERSG